MRHTTGEGGGGGDTKRCYMATFDNIVILNGPFIHVYCKCRTLYMLFNNVKFTFRLAIVRKVNGKDKDALVHAMKACVDLGYNSTNSEPRR
jgi:hypothetical protein